MAEKIMLTEVSITTKKYHLIFKGYVPKLDMSKIYEFDFIGSEICYTSAESMTKLALGNLTECLVKDFGCPPYNTKKVKEIFGNGKDYYVNFW